MQNFRFDRRISLAPAARGLGLGGRLLRLDVARGAGYGRCGFATLVRMRPAARLPEAAGFGPAPPPDAIPGTASTSGCRQGGG
jgi:GNAT superfamily N-acetyltransferase